MMRRWILISVVVLLVLLSGGAMTLNQRVSALGTATPAPTPKTADAVLFDDFNYDSPDDSSLSDNGWIVRTVDGWPGVTGAIWRKENVSFLADPDDENNHLMQMTSSTDGKTTYQTQVCQGRKFYEVTYATRVRWSNAPDAGPDGDNVVETFYL